MHAFIEIKRVAIEHSGVPAVLDATLAALAPVMAQCTLISYHIPVLRAARERAVASVGAILEKWHHWESDEVKAIHPDYLFCDAADLPRFGNMGQANTKVVIYEITEPEMALRLAGRGVGYIETFAIGEMLQAFELMRQAPA